MHRQIAFISTVLVLGALFVLAPPLYKQSYGAENVENLEYGRLLRHSSKNRIRGLFWQGGKQVLEHIEEKGTEGQLFAHLRGKYTDLESSLTWNGKKLARDKDGNFTLRVPLTEETNVFQFMAVTPRGLIETELMVVQVPHWGKIQHKPDMEQQRHFVSLGAGLSYILFDDNRIKSDGSKPYQGLSEFAVTGKLSYRYLLFPPRWDIGLSAYSTLIPVYANAPEGFWFFGFNARIGYVLPSFNPNWRLSLFGGVYASTMYVRSQTFGYVNVGGPQLFPVVSHELSSGSSISFYGKFSPVSKNFTILSFTNREIAGGFSYLYQLRNQHPFGFTFDYAHLQVTGYKNGQNITDAVQSFTLGIVYGL